MKRFLLFTLIIGLVSVQANAAIWDLTAPVARQFTQLSSNSAGNTLMLVIDSPGTSGSTTYLETAGQFGADGNPATYEAAYGDIMQLAVGFGGTAGQTVLTGADPEIWIGKAFANEFVTGDTLRIAIANDNDDIYRYTAWYSVDGSSIIQGTSLDLGMDSKGTVSVITASGPTGGAPTHFGFTLELIDADSEPDYFHTSVVPVPAAVILGILGMGVAGLKLRKYA
jgi:hypothetical protein